MSRRKSRLATVTSIRTRRRPRSAIAQVVEARLPGVPLAAEVDGRSVVLEGKDELVLRCGEASITLRRNGRIVIQGVQVETRAAGSNKIRGGSVQIN